MRPTPAQSLPLLAALVLALAPLGACAQRTAAAAPAKPAAAAEVSGPVGLQEPDPALLGVPADTTLVAGTTALPAMAAFDRPNGFWAVTAAGNAQGAVKAPAAAAAAPAEPAAPAPADADHAQAAAMLESIAQQDAAARDAAAPTVAAAAAPAPAAPGSAAPGSAAHAPATTVTTRPVQIGTLALPATAVPGQLHAARAGMIPAPVAARYDLYLLRVPLAWTPAKGFDRPLQRIAGDLALDPAAVRAGWRLLGISARGFEGLRRGPDPTFPNATGWWFKPKALAARLAGEVPATAAVWHEDAEARPLTGTLPLFALIMAPKDGRAADADIDAAVWFSPGDEARIALPHARLHIDLQRPALVATAGAPAAPAPAAVPAPANAH
jgi:hypothetical protein